MDSLCFFPSGIFKRMHSFLASLSLSSSLLIIGSESQHGVNVQGDVSLEEAAAWSQLLLRSPSRPAVPPTSWSLPPERRSLLLFIQSHNFPAVHSPH